MTIYEITNELGARRIFNVLHNRKLLERLKDLTDKKKKKNVPRGSTLRDTCTSNDRNPMSKVNRS